MADITVPHDRQFTDAQSADIIARATATLNVMQQLGATYQSLPGYAMADYQTDTDALEADVAAVHALAEQIRTKLISIDAKSGPLKTKNEGGLAALRCLLRGKTEEALLDQITGPQSSGGGGAAPPLPPNP